MANSPENYEHITEVATYENSGNSEEKEIFKFKFQKRFYFKLEKNFKRIFMRNIKEMMKWHQFQRSKKN